MLILEQNSLNLVCCPDVSVIVKMILNAGSDLTKTSLFNLLLSLDLLDGKLVTFFTPDNTRHKRWLDIEIFGDILDVHTLYLNKPDYLS